MLKAQGFSREERVRERKDFERVFREGRCARGRFLQVRFVANGLARSRLGIALSRGWKNAVARNRTKRLIREAFRTHKAALPKGLDLIVVPTTNWREPHIEEIASEIVRLLSRATEGRGS